MRTSNYRKKLHIDKKVWRIAGAGLAALLLAGVIFFFTYYRVENVEVMGSSHYTEEEVREMILRGPLASNSILAPILYSRDDVGDIPFVSGQEIKPEHDCDHSERKAAGGVYSLFGQLHLF